MSTWQPSQSDTLKTCSHSLIAANGSSIKTLGTRQMILNLGLQRYSWHFIITDVTQPIIGGDFLCSHSLFVDLINERLIRTDNLKTIKGYRSVHESFHISSLKSTNEFVNMLCNRPELTTPTFSLNLPKHGVLHRIPTTGFPVHCQARCLSPKKLKIAKEEFDTLLKLGIIRRSNSPYSSPLHVAPKPGGGCRPCGDYCRLNDSLSG